MTASPATALLRHPDFMRVWWAGLISWTGNGALFIAVPVHVYQQTHSTLATGLSVMMGAVASSLIGPLAGTLVDRWDLRRTLVVTNLALTGLTLVFLIALSLPWWWVLPTAFVQAAAGQLLGPAEHTLLPSLVGRDQLAAANSLNALNSNLARLLGPAIGGLLIASVGFAGVIVLDALSYLLAALLMLGVRAPARVRAPAGSSPPGNSHSGKRLLNEWQIGVQAVMASRWLRLSVITGALVGFGEGFISTLMVPWIHTMLGGGGRELGFILSGQAFGGLLAGVLMAKYAGRSSAPRLLGWGGLLSGACLVLILNGPLLYPAWWLTVVLTAMAGLPFTCWGTAQLLLLQTEAAPEVRGRVFSTYFAVFSTTQLLGMAVSGVLGDRLGVLVINVDAATYLLAGALVFSFARHNQATGAPDPAESHAGPAAKSGRA